MYHSESATTEIMKRALHLFPELRQLLEDCLGPEQDKARRQISTIDAGARIEAWMDGRPAATAALELSRLLLEATWISDSLAEEHTCQLLIYLGLGLELSTNYRPEEPHSQLIAEIHKASLYWLETHEVDLPHIGRRPWVA